MICPISLLTFFFPNRSIAQLEHLAEIYLLNTKHDDHDKFYAYGHVLEMNADTIAVTLGHLKQAVVIACKDEGKLDYIKS